MDKPRARNSRPCWQGPGLLAIVVRPRPFIEMGPADGRKHGVAATQHGLGEPIMIIDRITQGELLAPDAYA